MIYFIDLFDPMIDRSLSKSKNKLVNLNKWNSSISSDAALCDLKLNVHVFTDLIYNSLLVC